jgi:hypothetical protein
MLKERYTFHFVLLNVWKYLLIDIQHLVPTFGGNYYPDHLPVLGKIEVTCVMLVTAATKISYFLFDVKGASYSPPKESEIMAGDLIQVQLDADIFKMMQNEEHGGWNDRMEMVPNSA